MEKWQEAYQNYLGQDKIKDEIKALDYDLDSILKQKLPEDLYDQVYEKNAALEALHNEDGFHAGFIQGIIEVLKVTRSNQNLSYQQQLELVIQIAGSENSNQLNNFEDKGVFGRMVKVVTNGVVNERTLDEVIVGIEPMKIVSMELVPDEKGDPIVLVVINDKNGTYSIEFLACKGYQIHCINEFLRTLDLGINIEFQTYKQYGQLIWDCFDLLKTKQKATA